MKLGSLLLILALNADDGKRHAERAEKILQATAAKGHAPSQYALGAAAEAAGNRALATEWYRVAANNAYPGAQFSLGRLLEGADSSPAQRAEAIHWFRRAATEGFEPAIARLAALESAAEQADGSVQHALGRAAEADGRLEHALKLYELAASQNHPEAQFDVGRLLEGTGVEPATFEAIGWYRRAAAQNFEPAIERLMAIERSSQPPASTPPQAEEAAAGSPAPPLRLAPGEGRSSGFASVDASHEQLAIPWIELALLATVGSLVWRVRRARKSLPSGTPPDLDWDAEESLPPPPRHNRTDITLMEVDHMPGHEFERYMGRLLETRGFRAEVTKGSGDHGVDIVAFAEGISWAVQCKRQRSNVAPNAVRDAVAATRSSLFQCSKAMVITNSYFSKNAIEFAQSADCTLIDRDRLAQWIQDARGAGQRGQAWQSKERTG